MVEQNKKYTIKNHNKQEKQEKQEKKYVVVFDLDETLGHFEQLSIFWESLKKYFNYSLNKQDLFNLFDLFPKFLRPKIFKILKYLKDKKQNKICDKVMIYTNNNGREWPHLIKEYFDYKLQFKLFDQLIAAFKAHGEIIEVGRTSHDKSVRDLINCTKLPKNTQIFFLDDVMHNDMQNENVVYINIKPYSTSIPFKTMIHDYYTANKSKIRDKNVFTEIMLANIGKYDYKLKNKSDIEYKLDGIVSKKIISHLEEFFDGKKQRNITL